MFSFFNTLARQLAEFFVNLCIDFRLMRTLLFIFLIGALLASCVKKAPSDPIPELEYKDFQLLSGIGTDSAQFKIGYKDWDGDLFRNDNTDGPNTVISTFAFNNDSNKFIFDRAFAYVITQPADGYYKGKSIQGDIYIPVSEFRSDTATKKIMFEIFMVDMKGNKSNLLSTPQFTFN